MSKITIDTSNEIFLSTPYHEAVMQSTRVVAAMARWFGVDVEANIASEASHSTISFDFKGERAKQTFKYVGDFLQNNSDSSSAFIKPSQTDMLNGFGCVIQT